MFFIIDFDLLEESSTTLYKCRPNAKPDLLRKRDKLKSECYQRNIHLKLMPHVFSLARSNSSTIRNRKDATTESVTSEILWKVDWIFEDIKQTLTDTCLSETKTVRESLARFFDDSWKLGQTRHIFDSAGIGASTELEVFLINATKEKIPMNMDLPLRDAMAGQTLLEYPVFHVYKTIPAIPSE